jgi:hypothetical protein
MLLINLSTFYQRILADISSENPDIVGDLHLDIAEAYMSVGLHASAKPLLVSLVTSVEYNKVSLSVVKLQSCLAINV